MARGTSRAPSHNAYRGALGRTQQVTVHVTGPRGELVPAQVYTSIDAVADPELVDRLHSDDPARALNVVRVDGGDPIRVAVPVLYHDPAAELFVLVLGDAHRHRELDERIRVLERLRDDGAAVPAYVKELGVVYGASGLRGYLEVRAQEALVAARTLESHRDVDRRRAELAAREAELDQRARELDRRAHELDASKAELAARRAELDRERGDLERLRSEARNRVIAAVQQPAADGELTPLPAPPPGPAPRRPLDLETRPLAKEALEELDAVARAARPDSDAASRASTDNFEGLETGVVSALGAIDIVSDGSGVTPLPPIMPEPDDDVVADEETTGASGLPTGAIAPDEPEPTTRFTLERGAVRLTLVANELARRIGDDAEVRVLLLRAPTYPVVTLVFGAPEALRAPNLARLAIVALDIGDDGDRAVLVALGKEFELEVELIADGALARRLTLTAPLAENVRYILRAADDHLRGIAADGEPSFAAARELVLGPGFDVLGAGHADAGEFRDDKLAQLDTAQQVRRAIAIARRFARPMREDYLVCTRGFPLGRWRELRRAVLDRAVAWGLWMGSELAQVAVSEGLARSRRDLVVKLDRGFEALRKHAAFDLDADATADNTKAIAEEARALGVELTRGRNGAGAIDSGDAQAVSGSIGATPPHGTPRGKGERSVDELIALLDDRQQRLTAALALCDRGDARAAGPVIAAAAKMGRSDAVRVLGMAVKLGDAAKEPLVAGLASSKGYLRHGCALALALLRSEDGTQAVIDLLLAEPTEIWREVARAIGQVGPTALLPLASTYGRLGERATPGASERVAWAMAHVAVRGGKTAIETMAGGQSVVAPIARKALELHASAAKDHVRVANGGSQVGRDVTVNRAFSRKFFQALEQGLPDAAQAGLVDLEASSPMELLDEADLIEEPADDEAELDEADLIQT